MSVIVARPSCCTFSSTPIDENTLCVHGEYYTQSIAQSNTATFVIAQVASVAASKLLVSLYNDAETLVRTFEVLLLPRNTGTVDHVVYGITGYAFQVGVSFSIQSGNIQFTIENNDTIDINATIVHIPVPLNEIPPQTSTVPITSNQTVVSPMSTGCVDVVSTDWVGVKWALTISTSTTSTTVNVTSNTQQVNMFSVIGDELNATVTILTNGAFLSLMLTNNTTDFMCVQLTRIPIPSVVRPQMTCSTPSSAPGRIIPSQTIPSMQTSNVDGPIAKRELSAKWIVVLTNLQTYESHAFELSAALPSLSLVRYATIGKSWTSYISLLDLGTSVMLRLVNDIPSTVRVNILRLPSGI